MLSFLKMKIGPIKEFFEDFWLPLQSEIIVDPAKCAMSTQFFLKKFQYFAVIFFCILAA